MKTLLLSVLSLLFFCVPPKNNVRLKTYKSGDSVLLSLKKQKIAIDRYAYTHQKQILILVKLENKKDLVQVKNEDWPDETEFIFSILKDTLGHIIMIDQVPYSESGDWYVEYKHYFDTTGQVFAFSKRGTVFDDSVKGGVAVEELLNYYDKNKMFYQANRLTDKDEISINRKRNEFDFREFKYSIYKNLNECLANCNIKL